MRFHGHRSDLRRGIHDNKKLQYAWNKYGESAFRFEHILSCEKDLLLKNEQLLIDTTSAVKSGYNICPVAGNTIGVKLSPESRARMAAAQRGRKHSEETRKKMSETTRKMVKTRQHIHNLAISCLGKKMPPMTAEHKAKISAKNKGRKLSRSVSEVALQRIFDGMGRPHLTPEYTGDCYYYHGLRRMRIQWFRKNGGDICQNSRL